MAGKKINPEKQRSEETTPLRTAIQDMLKQYRHRDKYEEKRLVASWTKLVGKPIADRTEKVYINDKKLFVKVNSAPLRQELNQKREQILSIIHEEFGADLVKAIFII
ncbi:MAG: DUF721 domain-containing protein [Cyclobacteriaceae bacterium]|nr:DUF721 domain-containing protein [Cyclobacteriaceae bacterium]